jgi:hypothetical protein
MITEKIQKLQELEAQALKLKASIENERDGELAALPAKYGYDSLAAFVKALKQAAGAPKKGRKGKRRGRKPGKPGKRGRKPGRKAKKQAAAPAVAKAPKAGKKAGGRKRTKITPELKEQVKALVASGLSGSKIAKQFGISLPSVQNIKKEFGLVKARPAKAAEAPAVEAAPAAPAPEAAPAA